MTESVNVTSAVLDKKMEHYAWHANDYVAENEITVTITLAEYRDLIKSHATRQHDIDEANNGKYNRELENKKLKEEVECLRAKLYELQNRINFEREV